MFFNSSVFVKTWYWSWIWLVFVLGLKCASHLHKCCPNQECLCSYLTPIKRPDSALHPCQSSLRYNYLHVWLSTIQTWIEFARFFLEILLLLLSEYFADKTLELFHRPKPKHEKSLSQYWLCKYCLPNKLDRPRIKIEFFLIQNSLKGLASHILWILPTFLGIIPDTSRHQEERLYFHL